MQACEVLHHIFYFPCSSFTIVIAFLRAIIEQKGKEKMYKKKKYVEANVPIGIGGRDINRHCLVLMEEFIRECWIGGLYAK